MYYCLENFLTPPRKLFGAGTCPVLLQMYPEQPGAPDGAQVGAGGVSGERDPGDHSCPALLGAEDGPEVLVVSDGFCSVWETALSRAFGIGRRHSGIRGAPVLTQNQPVSQEGRQRGSHGSPSKMKSWCSRHSGLGWSAPLLGRGPALSRLSLAGHPDLIFYGLL